MPSRGTFYDDGQVDDDRLAADVCDVPLIRVLDMSKQDTLQVNALFLLLGSRCGELRVLLVSRGWEQRQKHQYGAEKWFEIIHFLLVLLLFTFL